MTNYLPGNRFYAKILLYVELVKGSSENDQKGPKSNDANFLKLIWETREIIKKNICLHRNDPFITF